MITRREILQVGAATAALTLGGGFTRAILPALWRSSA